MDIWGTVLLAIAATSLTYVVIGLIFQCLIRTNIMKPNKISRIFYYDDEMFINSWRKAQEEGILKYVLKNSIILTVATCIIGKLNILRRPQSVTMFLYLSVGAISSLIVTSILWSDNQNKYNLLIEKRNKEDGNINNDNKRN